jgi:hypothetical protein
MPSRFRIDLSTKKLAHGCAGEYFVGSGFALIHLAHIRKAVEKFTGPPAPEHLLIRYLNDTIVHETLHSLIQSGGSRRIRNKREHRAMARMLAWTDTDWFY